MPKVARGHPEQIVAKKESCLEFLKNWFLANQVNAFAVS